jgi:hypothetical protein
MGTDVPDPVAAELPDDLIIDVTVLPGRQLIAPDGLRAERSKFIVFPDGSLHADAGRSIGFLTRPGRVRTLSVEQLADLWLVLQQTGFAPAAADEEARFGGNPALLSPGAKEILTIVRVATAGQTSTWIRRTPGLAPPPPKDATPAQLAAAESAAEAALADSSIRVVRVLAGLAWRSELPPGDLAVLPIRYDYGPDPFAIFRPVPIVARPARAVVTPGGNRLPRPVPPGTTPPAAPPANPASTPGQPATQPPSPSPSPKP